MRDTSWARHQRCRVAVNGFGNPPIFPTVLVFLVLLVLSFLYQLFFLCQKFPAGFLLLSTSPIVCHELFLGLFALVSDLEERKSQSRKLESTMEPINDPNNMATSLPSRSYRPLRPAPAFDSSQTTPRPTQPEEPPPKRKVTEVACQSCRTRKSKVTKNLLSPLVTTCLPQIPPRPSILGVAPSQLIILCLF